MAIMRKKKNEVVDDENYVSKSQKKRDALALQDLGKQMISLKPEILKKLPMPESIQKAIVAAKPLKMGALKRQIQYIGKLLRDEEDLSDLHRALTVYFK